MAVDGKYDITMNSPMGKQNATFEFTTDGSKLSGRMSSMMGNVEFDDGTVDGNNLSWVANAKTPMGDMAVECSAVVDGDSLTGEAKTGSFGSASFSGTRVG
jgi:hypothetical protein